MKKTLIALSIFALLALLGAAVLGYQDWQLRGSAPGNPASGYLRTWADNTAGAFKCLTSAGAGCYWSTNYAGTYNTGVLPVANGGSGTSTPSLVAGTNITVSGSWPNQTIAASGSGGSGGVLCSSWIATDEGTTSTSYTNLTTTDSCTFSLSATGNIVMHFTTHSYNISAHCQQYDSFFLDGTQIDPGDQYSDTAAAANTYYHNDAVFRATSVGSGSHTMVVKHKTSSSTGHWADRLLVVETTP